MKQTEVFKKIGGILKELSDQYEYLQTVEGDLNDLELELFVSNAHFLTDHIEILRKLNLQNGRTKRPQSEKQEPVVREQKFFEPVVQQMKPAAGAEFKPAKEESPAIEPEIIRPVAGEPAPQIDLGSGSADDTYSFIREEEPETIRHELVLDESANWDDDELPVEPEVTEADKEHEAVPEIFEPVESIEAETTEPEPEVIPAPVVKAGEDEVLTINQKMQSQLGDKGATKTEQQSIKPISDIKLAITLNDKLLYVKDLFNGYNLAYSEAIEILNRFNTFEEASRFLKTNYVTKNNWDSKPATTEKFYALLKRRYA